MIRKFSSSSNMIRIALTCHLFANILIKVNILHMPQDLANSRLSKSKLYRQISKFNFRQ